MENATNHQMADKRAMTIRDSRTDQLAEALQTCLLSVTFLLSHSFPTINTQHSLPCIKTIETCICIC